MATYAIGDIQGCYAALQALLERVEFQPDRDRLWLVGDLVNRGPDSLSVLRWAKQAGPAAVAVLGNHDVHLLARAYGLTDARRGDTLDAVLNAPDRDELIDWLRHRPLVHRVDGSILVHAGLLPAWSVSEAAIRAAAVESALRTDPVPLLTAIVRARSGHKTDHADPLSRLTETLGILTRIRTCRSDGSPDYSYNGPLEGMPAGLVPWFRVPGRRSTGTTVIFGHWAAMGFRMESDLIALDSGCVWGNALTGVRLEDRRVFHVPCPAD